MGSIRTQIEAWAESMVPRLTELIKDIQILERDIRQYYQRLDVPFSDSLHNVQKTIEKDTVLSRW